VRRSCLATLSAVLITGLLTGCTPIDDVKSLGESVDPYAHLPRSVFSLMGDGDMPDGANFRPNHDEILDPINTQRQVDWWTSFEGSPLSCYGVWGVENLAANGVGSAKDLVLEIGYFEYDYNTQGGVWASARQFQDAASAEAFLAFIETAVEACPDGFTGVNDDGSGWRIDSVSVADVTPLLDLPERVRVVDENELHENELTGAWEPSTRFKFIQYRNVVVRIACEVRADSPFTFDDCSRLTETVASRLVALRF
jgi:hypothetical protein